MKMQAINYDNLTVRSSNEDLTIPSLNNTTFVVHELSPQLTLKKSCIESRQYDDQISIDYENALIKILFPAKNSQKTIYGKDIYQIKSKHFDFYVGEVDFVQIIHKNGTLFILSDPTAYQTFKTSILNMDENLLIEIYYKLLKNNSAKKDLMGFWIKKLFQENIHIKYDFATEFSSRIAERKCSRNSFIRYFQFNTKMQIKRNLRSNFENWIETIDMPNILSVDIKYSSLDNFEKSLEWILPSHRQEYFQEKKRFLVNDIIKYIIPPCGKDFKNIDEATTKYMNKIIDELNYIIKSDIKQSKRIIWACQLLHQETKNYRDMSKVIQETTFKDIYLKTLLQIILSNRVELLENMATEFVNRAVPLIYETVQNNKVKTTRIFENGSITESVKLCEIYESKKTEIMELISYVKECNVSTNFLDSQLQFYNYGMTLLNKRINDLQKNKARCKYIDDSDYKNALIFMYSTNSLEEANAIMQKNIYKYNKRKGEFAEKNVEHMLSFLGKDKYITIPKKSEGRYGDKCILLHNPTAYEHPQEYDHIIIGSQGIFLIETKNYSGKICIGKAGNWARTGKHGDVKNDKDPLIQIKHHEKVMASIVGEKVNIFSILCLANQSVKIQNANYFPRPILKSDALTDFIETLEVENPLSTEEMNHLKELILKYSK